MRSLTEILENKPGSSDKEIILQYSKRKEGTRETPAYGREAYKDIIEDDDGKDFDCAITYEYREADDFYSGHHKVIIDYNAYGFGDYRMSKESFDESVRNSIEFKESTAGYRVVFDTRRI